MYLSSAEIRSSSEHLKARWENCLAITGIQKLHIFRPAGSADLLVGRYASVSLRAVQIFPSEQNLDRVQLTQPVKSLQMSALHIGDWVLVKYDEKSFSGEVKAVGEQEVQVSVMVPSGATRFKWPAVKDAIFYKMEDVLMKLQPPILKSARGSFQFAEKF